jgi:predicted RNA-binding protein with PIN domain
METRNAANEELIDNNSPMTYLIDGHNLIGQLPDMSLDDPNDEAILVQKLRSFTTRTKTRCVVVFDHGVPGGESRLSSRMVQVVFASQRSSADRVMIDRIGKIRDANRWTVVSSDREVLAVARERHMKTLSAEEFVRLMNAPPKPVIDAGEAADVHLSPEEVDEWLEMFGSDEDE